MNPAEKMLDTHLSKRERSAERMEVAIKMRPESTFREIGEFLGVNAERARQIVKQSIREHEAEIDLEDYVPSRVANSLRRNGVMSPLQMVEFIERKMQQPDSEWWKGFDGIGATGAEGCVIAAERIKREQRE